jgi:hypothetical protein
LVLATAEIHEPLLHALLPLPAAEGDEAGCVLSYHTC